MSDKFGSNEFYKSFIKNNDYKLTQREYSNITDLFYKLIIDEIIFNNYDFKINRLGTISLYKIKEGVYNVDDKVIMKYCVDRKKSSEYGKKIRFENDHTNGYIYVIKFNKLYNSYGKRLYFKPNRYKFKRYLASLLKDSNIKINAKEHV